MPADTALESRRGVFRVAIRKFDPFEAAIRERWASFCNLSGCGLRLEAEAFDVNELHGALFARGKVW